MSTTSLFHKISTIAKTFSNVLGDSEAEGNDKNDTYICRKLRDYYNSKHMKFPEWLPPDPNAPQTYNRYGTGSAAASQQSLNNTGSARQWGNGSRSGGLSDLWDTPKQQQDNSKSNLPTSLRPGRGNTGAVSQQQLQPPQQQQRPPMPGGFGNVYSDPNISYRANSGTSSFSGNGNDRTTSPAPSTGGSAKDMLKAKLFGGGGRSASPVPSSGGASSYASPQGSLNLSPYPSNQSAPSLPNGPRPPNRRPPQQQQY